MSLLKQIYASLARECKDESDLAFFLTNVVLRRVFLTFKDLDSYKSLIEFLEQELNSSKQQSVAQVQYQVYLLHLKRRVESTDLIYA